MLICCAMFRDENAILSCVWRFVEDVGDVYGGFVVVKFLVRSEKRFCMVWLFGVVGERGSVGFGLDMVLFEIKKRF